MSSFLKMRISLWVTDENIGTTIELNGEIYEIMDRCRCSEKDLYFIKSRTPRHDYTGICPMCEKPHFPVEESITYYATVENIQNALKAKRELEKASKVVPPLADLPRTEEPKLSLKLPIIGREKGIQGNSNSCYMDATLFCMFTYNDRFDHFLTQKVDKRLEKLQDILKHYIVYPLRDQKNGTVDDRVIHHFRKELSKVTEDKCFQEVERDPSEFLRALEKLFSYSPIKTGHPEQPFESNPSKATSNMIWEMFDANFEKRQFIKIADIFRNSLSEIPAKLLSVPPVLILMAPRHTSSKRSYPYIIPDREISIDGQMLQVFCRRCGMTNCRQNRDLKFYYCRACLQNQNYPNDQASVMGFCYKCLEESHQALGGDKVSKTHSAKQISGELSRLRLFAVLCIETSHYVAFVRCSKNTDESEWVFFDSMSDRIGNITNVPCVSNCPKFEQWIEKAENDNSFFRDLEARRNGHGSLTQRFPGESLQMLRLFRDGAFFFYENMSADYF